MVIKYGYNLFISKRLIYNNLLVLVVAEIHKIECISGSSSRPLVLVHPTSDLNNSLLVIGCYGDWALVICQVY